MVAVSSFCGMCDGRNHNHFSRLGEFRLCALWLQLQAEREEVVAEGVREVMWGRVTSDPTDRLILSFQQPPLSLLFTSLKERRGEKRVGRNNEASPGGDEMEEVEEEEMRGREKDDK